MSKYVKRLWPMLNQHEAQAVDVELMSSCAFSIDQLMEMAGQAVAMAAARSYPLSSHQNVLIVVGPGNNGGDGLVAARHLAHFGYTPTIVYPKRTDKDLYRRLVIQCKDMDMPILSNIPTTADIEEHYGFIVDAIFGFSFRGHLRSPFNDILRKMAQVSIPICSIDVPSGWNVESGPPTDGPYLNPDVLISLTAPKLCAEFFKGRQHWLGGRFVSHSLKKQFPKLDALPSYKSQDYIVELD